MRYALPDMDSASLITAGGVAVAAAGLYLLAAVPRARWDAPGYAGGALVILGAAAAAVCVLQPTGSFAGLLIFALVSAGAAAGVVTMLSARSAETGWLALGVTALFLAGVMSFRGAGPPVIAVALCGLAAFVVGFRRRRRNGATVAAEPDSVFADHREPLLGCTTWAVLAWVLLRGLALPAGSPEAAVLNNQLAVGSVIFTGGLLSIFVHRARDGAACGLAAATLGLVVLLWANSVTNGSGEGDGATFAAIVVATGVLQVAGIAWFAGRDPGLRVDRESAERGALMP